MGKGELYNCEQAKTPAFGQFANEWKRNEGEDLTNLKKEYINLQVNEVTIQFYKR